MLAFWGAEPTSNYAFKPIAELALCSNQTIVPQRLNAALAVMTELNKVNEPLIHEARKLLEAAYSSSDETRHDLLMCWVREILEPLARAGIAEAMWLLCGIPTHSGSSLADFDRNYRAQIEAAAAAGSLDAKFRLACELDETETSKRSAELFKEVAEAGYPYAMWCHGLNLLSGKGLPQDKEAGLVYIREAAERKFEGAIHFVSAAYGSGAHGFPVDPEAAAKWWKNLGRQDLIRY